MKSVNFLAVFYVKNICHNKDTKELVIELCHEMQKEFIERMETGTQTIPYPDTISTQNERIMTDVECQTDSDADGILQMISELEDDIKMNYHLLLPQLQLF